MGYVWAGFSLDMGVYSRISPFVLLIIRGIVHVVRAKLFWVVGLALFSLLYVCCLSGFGFLAFVVG